jgi:cyanophycinase
MRALMLFAAGLMMAQETPRVYDYFLTGNAADVQPKTEGGYVLMGGGKDVDRAFEWMLRKSGGGDFVVVRASGADGYNAYVKGLAPVDSVESLVVKTPEAARNPEVLDRIRKAEALFIAGGDQWNYVRVWGPSPVRDEIQKLIDRGVPVGGTSAGLAVLGQFAFTAEKDSVTSEQALRNPYDERVTVGENFLKIPILRGIITDSHFRARDRMGRLLVFLARILEDRKAAGAGAIALDERTAALVEPGGAVAIEGEGPAYFIRAAGPAELCRPGAPLTLARVSVYRVTRGGAFDLKAWRGQGGTAYTLSVDAGVVRSSQPGGAIY